MNKRIDKQFRKWLRFIVLAAIMGPVLINIAYSCGDRMQKPIFITKWGPEDLLSYYGTILSAVITVIVLRITILGERAKMSKEVLPSKIDEASRAFHQQLESISALIELCETGKQYESMTNHERKVYTEAMDYAMTQKNIAYFESLRDYGADTKNVSKVYYDMLVVSFEVLELVRKVQISNDSSVDYSEMQKLKNEVSSLNNRIDRGLEDLRISLI